MNNANDLISRGDAIDIVVFECGKWTGLAKEISKQLKRLPSAQPEIIRCRDCKHFEYDHPYIIHGVPVLGHEVCNAWGDGCKTDENGYCFMAERKEDVEIH